MTHLRKMMLEELERRNYAQTTIHCYLRAVAEFSLHFNHPPNQLWNGAHPPVSSPSIRATKASTEHCDAAACRLAILLHQDTEEAMEYRRDSVSQVGSTVGSNGAELVHRAMYSFGGFAAFCNVGS